MNRLMLAAFLSLTAFGCAVGVDEPVPEPAPEEPQRDPPKQTLSGTLDNPLEHIAVGIAEYRTVPDVSPRQLPPIPGR